ncbi:BrnA antitoxin family protein [uncultured Methylobacterium sp.]|jgi:uncharacterized protein (DUF4415 family)|uniref:BrnA antitoxin family protein n=1 Tax=uncultured Methylobacterium sp. TaxID=157278 RepID=UPI0026281B3A|nr:BrnA antitoxin family protein [uncultured Methylobacterium sp.]
MPRDRSSSPVYVPNPDYTQEDWDEVSDNPPVTEEEMRTARPFREAMPDVHAALTKARGPQKAPVKQLVSLRLDRDVIDKFKATGPGWQTRINEALKRS